MTRRLIAALCASTALVSGAAYAQSGNEFTEEQIAQLSPECQEVARFLMEGRDIGDVNRDDAVAAVTEDQAERCVDLTALMGENSERTQRSQTAQAQDSEQVRDEASDTTTARVELNEQALIEGLARVRVPDPQVDVDVPAPNVRITSADPEIAIQGGAEEIEIEQGEPRISVEIPELVVRVEIPAPKLYIRSDNPSVDVSMADPRVEVEQGDPSVSVTQGEPQIAMDLDVEEGGSADPSNEQTARATKSVEGADNAEGNVRVARAEPRVEILRDGEGPRIRYSAAEPNVSYNPADPSVDVRFAEQPRVEVARVGEIEVQFETAEERDQRRQAQADRQPQQQQTEGQQQQQAAANDPRQQTQQGGEGSDSWMVTVGQLLDMPIVGADGQNLGTADAFVRENGQLMIVMSEGGFLGIGGKEVALPLSRFDYSEEALRLNGVSQQDLQNAQAFRYDGANRVSEDFEIRVRQN